MGVAEAFGVPMEEHYTDNSDKLPFNFAYMSSDSYSWRLLTPKT